MAFDFSFELDHNLVFIKASVNIDFVSSTQAMQALLSDQRFSKHMGILVDIRDVDYVISGPEIERLLHSPTWLAIIDGHKVATVAGKPAQYGMATVLARRTGDTAAIETFYDIEEARSWLGAS